MVFATEGFSSKRKEAGTVSDGALRADLVLIKKPSHADLTDMSEYTSMDAETRRKVFWLLQRLTSFALWKKKRDAWEAFAIAYEDAVKTWPTGQPERVLADNLPRIYKVLSLYNEGLVELGQGNRFVWNRDGAFKKAVREYRVVSNFLYPHPDYWERGIQEAPYPPKVEVLNQLMRASEFHGDAAPLEIFGNIDESAFLSSPNFLLDPKAYQYRFYQLRYPVFPKMLPEVPPPTNTIVRSGQIIPRDGIWEPVDVQRNRLLGLIPIGKTDIEGTGCFNYFAEGAKAPKIIDDYNESTQRFDRINTHWRLAWEDNRYRDGIVPDELEYFLEPGPLPIHGDIQDEKEVRTNEICPSSSGAPCLTATMGIEIESRRNK